MGEAESFLTKWARVIKGGPTWRCPECGRPTFARVAERKADGKFGPGPQVRCVHCKAVSDWPSE